MGVVYQAHDPVIDRQVAIKLVLADLLEDLDRDAFLERFRLEAQAAGRCVHANIVTVFDFATHEGNPFLAMEFVDGSSLAQRRPTGAQARQDSVAIVLQILAGLQAAHAHGIVHRDIKPANVLLTGTGQVKITDFGVARLARSSMTQTGMIVGTLSYMSPEQCRGDPVDQRADLFSTSCILHELLLGVRPFPGQTEASIMLRLLQEPPFVPPDAGLPPALLGVLSRGLAKNPDDRFASAAEMAAALRASLQAPQEDDQTIVMARPAAPPRSPQSDFDPSMLSQVERQLAAYVGPIAHTLVQSAARRAPSLEALRDLLAGNIDKQADRQQFLRGAGSTAAPAGEPAPSTAAALSPAIAATAQRELARHLGPIASIMVKRALPSAKSAGELWDALAVHIDKAADRAVFLRSKP
jgi:serine/threonine-protein kinase